MVYKNQPWFSDLGLNEEQFSTLPEGENPLFWALENEVLDPEAFAKWSSEFFQKPRLQNRFFHMALDQSLPEKHKGIYSWSSHCYPVYEWEGILYIACLEPLNIETEKNICYLIGQFDALKQGWKESQAPEAPSVENWVPEIPTTAEATPQNTSTPPPAPDLDFSDLSLGDGSSVNTLPEAPKTPEKVLNETPSKESKVLSDLSFGDLSPSDEPMPAIPAQEVAPAATAELIEDDYMTPPPTTPWEGLSEPENKSTPSLVETALDEEVTQTDNSIPIFIPKDKRITDDDLSKYTNIDLCHGTKEVLSHIFYHLTKDFKKMMWIELSESGQFFPRFVYGSWPMDQNAWTHPIDVSKPNIFRIAFKSGLPFHGEVVSNEINETYFQRWNGGATPDQVTAFPLLFDEACYGFIVCFDKGPSFDELDTLKKMENLVSISDRAFRNIQEKKAS